MIPNKLETPVQFLKGVGPKRAGLFKKLDIVTVENLLYHFPRRYLDRSQMMRIKDAPLNQNVTLIGKVVTFGLIKTRKRMKIFNLVLQDETDYIHCKWFNQDYLKDIFKVGQTLVVSGQVTDYRFQKQLVGPEYEILGDQEDEEDLIHTGRIVPVYPATAGLYQKTIRQVMDHALGQFLADLTETLPISILRQYSLLDIHSAVQQMHFPQSWDEQKSARRRLAFEELFYLQLMLALRQRLNARPEEGLQFRRPGDLVDRFRQILPFDLTNAQKRVIREVFSDLESPVSMNRLLHGEVGSGKTMVAAFAAVHAVGNDYQAAVMAPTEILAEQLARKMIRYLEPLRIHVSLLTGKMRKKQKDTVLADIQTGHSQVVVGTHALIQEGVDFRKLGLVIVDEQHRFGVLQRATLRQKGENPNVLVMTATPIPRTLAMTLYGDLEVSVLDELPQGRQAIKTRWTTEKNRAKVYEMVRREINKGRQIYIVYPLVAETEKVDLKAATEMQQKLQKDVFPDWRIGLLHGKMKSAEKDAVMTEFSGGQIQILVSTTVIEVGIDVPNASTMIIEHAERFGLTQLHQLRGRVGRGPYTSFCILMAEYPISTEAKKRLDIIQSTTDGFQIAEADMEIRGPGEFFGTRQHGLPELRVANLLEDQPILALARQQARELIGHDPGLSAPENDLIRRVLSTKYRERIKLAEVS